MLGEIRLTRSQIIDLTHLNDVTIQLSRCSNIQVILKDCSGVTVVADAKDNDNDVTVSCSDNESFK